MKLSHIYNILYDNWLTDKSNIIKTKICKHFKLVDKLIHEFKTNKKNSFKGSHWEVFPCELALTWSSMLVSSTCWGSAFPGIWSETAMFSETNNTRYVGYTYDF